MTFEIYRKAVLASVEDIGRGFTAPDDDWIPVLLSFGKRPRILALTGDKESWPDVASSLKEDEPVFVAAVLSSWMVETSQWDDSQPPPSKHPDRIEVVFVEMFDGHTLEIWEARIIRFFGHPPTLGEWQKRDITEVQGRLGSIVMNPFNGVVE